MFFLGLMFMMLGITTGNPAFWVMGIVFMVLNY